MSQNHKTFELKIEHIALIKGLVVDVKTISLIGCTDTKLTPFGGNSLEEDLVNLLVGRELTDEEKDKLTAKGETFRSKDDIELLKTIYSELPQALDVVLNSLSFQPGTYRTRWYERNWKLID
jgi:hypothetical protein